MHRSSTVVRLGGVLSLLVWLSSVHAARLPDTPHFPAAPPQVLDSFAPNERPCGVNTLGEAVSLIYEQNMPDQAQALAHQCLREARSQGHAFKSLIAVRIQALLAMRFRDLDTLHQAGQALVQQRTMPEYVPDGHMCLAFTCLASGDTQCARNHLTLARNQFTKLQIPQALDQLAPLEEALQSMEAASESAR
jgi:hypothetical protein